MRKLAGAVLTALIALPMLLDGRSVSAETVNLNVLFQNQNAKDTAPAPGKGKADLSMIGTAANGPAAKKSPAEMTRDEACYAQYEATMERARRAANMEYGGMAAAGLELDAQVKLDGCLAGVF